jgi:anti-sigma B factor antagonist
VIVGIFRNLRVTGDPMSYMAAFRVTFEAIEDACLLRVGGQIDSSKAAEFRKHLRNARLEGHTSLVDLANVSFIDSAGLRAWLEESEAATNAGVALFIVRPSGVIRRMIEITDTADRLAVVPASNEISLLHGRRKPSSPLGSPSFMRCGS